MTDLRPIWNDCPFKEKLPAGVVVRRGQMPDGRYVVDLDQKSGDGVSVIFSSECLTVMDFDVYIRPMIEQMGWAT